MYPFWPLACLRVIVASNLICSVYFFTPARNIHKINSYLNNHASKDDMVYFEGSVDAVHAE